MSRPAHTRREQRFLGDDDRRIVHDLQKAVGACEIDEILDENRGVRFEPDNLEQAEKEKYTACHRCASTY